jgi:hypothetical protein
MDGQKTLCPFQEALSIKVSGMLLAWTSKNLCPFEEKLEAKVSRMFLGLARFHELC